MTAVDRPDNGQHGYSDGTVLWGPATWTGTRWVRYGVSSTTAMGLQTTGVCCDMADRHLGHNDDCAGTDLLRRPTPEPCPVYSHGSDGWHCAVEGPHEHHRNAAGDVTW